MMHIGFSISVECFLNTRKFIEVGPQSLCNRSFCDVFLCCHVAFFYFSVGVGALS